MEQHSCHAHQQSGNENTQCFHEAKSQQSCIRLVPIFNHLEQEQLEEIMHVTSSKSFKKGETIYSDGDASDSLYIVSRGKIRIYRLSESGKEQLVRILSPGDFTGELALFREAIHSSYAEAMLDSAVCMITRPALQAFLLKFPSISLKILSEFSNRLNTSETQATRLATEKAETRIASFLVECLEDPAKSMIVELPMTKKDMASYLGTTPETISRKLAELEDAGYIRQKTSKKIEILDFDSLLLI